MDQAGLQPTTGFLAAAPREEDEKIKASGSDGSVRLVLNIHCFC
jgi:hypothetical protein